MNKGLKGQQEGAGVGSTGHQGARVQRTLEASSSSPSPAPGVAYGHNKHCLTRLALGREGDSGHLGRLLLGWAKATGCTPVPFGSLPLSWEQWATSAHHIPLALSLGGRHLEPPRAEPLAMQPSRRGRGCDAGRGCWMPGSGGTPSRGLISSSCPDNADRPGRSFLNLWPGPHVPHPALPWAGGGGVSFLCWKQGLCGDLEGRRKGVSWACEPSLPIYLPSPSGLPPAASAKPRPASISAFQGVCLGKFSP